MCVSGGAETVKHPPIERTTVTQRTEAWMSAFPAAALRVQSLGIELPDSMLRALFGSPKQSMPTFILPRESKKRAARLIKDNEHRDRLLVPVVSAEDDLQLRRLVVQLGLDAVDDGSAADIVDLPLGEDGDAGAVLVDDSDSDDELQVHGGGSGADGALGGAVVAGGVVACAAAASPGAAKKPKRGQHVVRMVSFTTAEGKAMEVDKRALCKIRSFFGKVSADRLSRVKGAMKRK